MYEKDNELDQQPLEPTPNYYSVLPANIRYDSSLSGDVKVLYSEITALCNKQGYCWASNSYFSSLYNKNIRTIQRWISVLEKQGYISTELFYKPHSNEVEQRRIYINLSVSNETNNLNTDTPGDNFNEGVVTNVTPPSDKCDTGVVTNVTRGWWHKCHGGGDKNVMDNTTRVNTTRINNKSNIKFNTTTTTTTDSTNSLVSKESVISNDLKQIQEFYIKNSDCLGEFTQWVQQDLESWFNAFNHNQDVIIHGLTIALDNQKKYAFAKGVFKNWANLDLRTLEAIKDHERDYKAKHSRGNSLEQAIGLSTNCPKLSVEVPLYNWLED